MNQASTVLIGDYIKVPQNVRNRLALLDRDIISCHSSSFQSNGLLTNTSRRKRSTEYESHG